MMAEGHRGAARSVIDGAEHGGTLHQGRTQLPKQTRQLLDPAGASRPQTPFIGGNARETVKSRAAPNGVWGLRPQRVQGRALAFLCFLLAPIGLCFGSNVRTRSITVRGTGRRFLCHRHPAFATLTWYAVLPGEGSMRSIHSIIVVANLHYHAGRPCARREPGHHSRRQPARGVRERRRGRQADGYRTRFALEMCDRAIQTWPLSQIDLAVAYVNRSVIDLVRARRGFRDRRHPRRHPAGCHARRGLARSRHRALRRASLQRGDPRLRRRAAPEYRQAGTRLFRSRHGPRG